VNPDKDCQEVPDGEVAQGGQEPQGGPYAQGCLEAQGSQDAQGCQDDGDSSIRYVNCTVLDARLIVIYMRCINCLGYWLTYTEVGCDSFATFTIS
jgi:hypothetical protein